MAILQSGSYHLGGCRCGQAGPLVQLRRWAMHKGREVKASCIPFPMKAPSPLDTPHPCIESIDGHGSPQF